MKLKPLFAAAACITLLTACGAAEEPTSSTETSSKTETADADLSVSAPAESRMESGGRDASESLAVDDPIPSDVVDEKEAASNNDAATTENAGTKSKGKFMTTYDAKRKKRFIPKCEREMAQDLKPDQVGEACNCLFDELAITLDGIKERLNPPAAKVEAANEKCLSKYI